MKSQHKILLMEHDPKESEKISDLLQCYGFSVTTVSSGYEALRVLFNYTPELIIGNVNLPYINSFDILKAVKGNKKLKHIPLIITSKVLEEHCIYKSKKLGAAAYIKIPSTCGLLYAVKRSLNLELLDALYKKSPQADK